MILFHAIDLRNGRCVRLRQGRAEQETVFSEDPAEVARRWHAAGARWLHVVNLDGAFGATSEANRQAIRAIIRATNASIQLGGGLRDLDAMEAALGLGAARVVLGTIAVTEPRTVEQAVQQFGGDRIVVGIDAMEGNVAISGWQSDSGLTATELALRVQSAGVGRIVYTDISRDGMLSGPNLPALTEMVRTGLSVIASGGISSLDDLRAVSRVPGVEGAIVGMALYTGAIDLGDAIRVLGGS